MINRLGVLIWGIRMRGKNHRESGLRSRRLFSILVAAFFLTGVLTVLPFGTQNAKAYVTPPGVYTWDQMMFDADMMTAGMAVTYMGPYMYMVHEDIIIDQTSIINTEGPEMTQMTFMGIQIIVEGQLNAMMGGMFMGFGTPGDWMGIRIQGSGSAMISSAMIYDAVDGITIDNSMLMGASAMIDHCFIDNCAMSGISIIDDNSNPWVTMNTITNCGVGIFCTGDTDAMIMQNQINNNMMYGIHLMSVINGVNIDSNTISDNMEAGIMMDDSMGFIMNNGIYGWNATFGSLMAGGPGIHMTGNPVWSPSISWNTIIGGQGDEYGIAGQPPNGGHGIWLDHHEGMAAGTQVFIENNLLLKGGDGGPNTLDNGLAGAGGDGIHCNRLPDFNQWWMDEYSIEIFNNQQIIGGHGGDNNAATNGWSGDGGRGIYLSDDDLMGSTLASQNMEIRGGNGGNNTADHVGGDTWLVGNGGDAISAFECYHNTKTDILDNSLIVGGKGGNATGIGNFGSAGFGGNGIGFYGTTNASISTNGILAGKGGDITNVNLFAGSGGDGIHLTPNGTFESSAMIMTCDATGGVGGDSYVAGGPGGGGTGNGGDGLSTDGAGTYGSTWDNDFTGGKGGNTYGDSGLGGNGGRGINVFNGAGADAWNSGRIIGGDGGDTLYNGPPGFGSWGGFGGTGAYAENAGTMLFIWDQSLITGGNGGDNMFDIIGMPGEGANAIIGVLADVIDIQQNSEITTGSGGYNWPTSSYGSQGSMCIQMGTIAFGATIIGNTVHECDTRGISFTSTNGQISNNEVYNCSTPTLSDGVGIYCVQNSNPLIELNLVHDNKYAGIHCSQNSNPEILRNTIWNTTKAGISCASSSPHIDRTTIDNSGEYGISLDFGSCSPLIENCTISNSGITDFYIDDDSHPVCLNTTNDKTATYNDAASTLTMNWFMHTEVVDPGFVPVAGADVWINDTFGTNILTGVTPANGWLNWTVVNEFIENQAGRIYYTNHNGTAIAGLQEGWALPEPNMDGTQSVTIVLGLPAWNIYLDPGWNLISLPLIPVDTSYGEVLKSIDGQWDRFLIYNSTFTNSDIWKSNDINKPAALNEVADLYHTQGIWIHTNAPAPCLTVIGTVPVSTDIFLYAGWNLVGYPSFMPLDVASALVGTGYDGIVEFDGTNPYMLGDMLGTDIMNPGNGYWVHVPADTVWTVDW